MNVRLSIFTAVAALALSVAAPTAFGEGRLAGSLEPDGVASFRANELASAASSSLAPSAAVDYFRANERSSTATVVPTQATGPEATIDWPSIAIGIGLGVLALGLGILLTMRFRPNRPLAH